MDPGTYVPIIIAFVALLAATPVVRRQRKKATVELEESTLAVAQREIQIERDARLASEDRCTARITALEAKHDREMAVLRESHASTQGQLSVLTESFANVMADAVIRQMNERGAL